MDAKNILLVSSGKGGVGKSTVATNLAIALAREGYKTGILDADLYGPSIPMNMGVQDKKIRVESENGTDVFYPIEAYGIQIMSLGFLVNKEQAVIWRGPMVTKALTQLISNTKFTQLDFLVVDLPPGTGDINISIAQKLPQSKALVVITPQNVAVADGRKAMSMFNSGGITIPVLGVVENMSWFTPAKHPDEQYRLFGEGGGAILASEFKVPLLAQLPLVSDVCELGDTGKTAFASENESIVKAFEGLASNVLEQLGM